MERRASNHFLHFTRREKNGILAVLCFTVLVSTAPYAYVALTEARHQVPVDEKLTPFLHQPDSANITVMNSGRFRKAYRPYHHNREEQMFANNPALFYFDPNTLDADGWKKLGVREKTIEGIQKYISKGGRFRKPEDIRKIWGLPTVTVERLLPYVKIAREKVQDNDVRIGSEKQERYFKAKQEPIDINLADSATFESLPGIGPALSRRIISFRSRLGGFHSTGQVAETFGLPDSTFQKIQSRLVLHSGNIKKISLNTATLDELKQHPYIRYAIANAIIAYRNQHGPFRSPEDLKKIILIDDSIYLKILPYIRID